jgi:hypothetical protein
VTVQELAEPERPAATTGTRLATGLDAFRARLADLFAPAERGRADRSAALMAGALVVLATVYSIGRVGGPGALNTVWGEDATNFMTDAYNRPALANIFTPINGYFLVVPRVLAEFAGAFPPEWAAWVLSATTALLSGAMALLIYVASGNVLRHPLARAVAAAGIVAAPLGESMYAGAPNTPAALQFAELYALFWCVMWTPVGRVGRAVQLTVVPLCGVSTFLAVFFIPLALMRCWARRDRLSLGVLAGFLFGAAFQVFGLLSGLSSRGNISHPRLDPFWALRSFVTWAWPYGLLGQTGVRQPGLVNRFVHTGGGAGPWYWVAVAAAWALVAAVILVAVLRWTRPRWLFAVIAAGQGVAMLCLQVMIQGELVLRYAFAPCLLVVAALVALLLPRPDLPRWRALAPLLALALVVGAGAVANYRVDTMRARSAPWDANIRRARAACVAKPETSMVRMVMKRGLPWHVDIPCARLR